MPKICDKGFAYELTFNKTRRDIGDIFENSFGLFFFKFERPSTCFFFILHFMFASRVSVFLVMKANSWFIIFTYLHAENNTLKAISWLTM